MDIYTFIYIYILKNKQTNKIFLYNIILFLNQWGKKKLAVLAVLNYLSVSNQSMHSVFKRLSNLYSPINNA